jgi:glycosyltransferase involved in cell wall biosynthesis
MRILMAADAHPMSFVRVDHDILASAHQVAQINFQPNVCHLVATIRAMLRSDLLFGWFAGPHCLIATLMAVMRRQPIILASSDYDLAKEAAFDYGSMRGGPRKWINNLIFRCADRVIVPWRFSRELALRNTVLGRRTDNLRTIPHGFADRWEGPTPKQRQIATVGTVNRENWIRKGHRDFVRVARGLDGVAAYLAGRVGEDHHMSVVSREAPPNLTITGHLTDRDLKDLLARTQAYLQLSYMEGFGCSLAEAMLARCAPIVTRNGSLPEVVGDCGYYVDYGQPDAAREAVTAALEDRTIGRRARARVLDCFPLARRGNELLALVNELRDDRRAGR